jgi:glycosyltransferase involved in cell wall biosynthesis
MKIIELCSGYDIGYNGGITNYVRSLSDSLSLAGNEVYVIDSQKNIPNKLKYNFTKIKLINDELKPFHLNNSINNDDAKEFENILLKIKPDIVHIHMMIDLPFNIINIAKKYSKVIISLHDYSYICNRITMFDNNDNLCLNSNNGIQCNSCISMIEQNKYLKYIYDKFDFKNKSYVLNLFHSSDHTAKHEFIKGIFKNIDLLIAVSSRVKEIYKNNGLDNKNFIINHIGNITANNFVKKKNHIDGKIKIAFIGYFSKYKGAELVIKFSEYLDSNKFEIIIFGRIDEKYLDVISNNKLISYFGTYQQDNLSQILESINLGFVLPIWEDNAPQVVFEFINNGIPVIGTLMGGIPDFVINGKNGLLIEPTDEAINNIANEMNDEDFNVLLQSMSCNILPTKSVEAHNLEIIDLYNKLLK